MATVAGALMAAINIGEVASAPAFSIRNGPLTAATNIYVRPTIPRGHWWVPVQNLNPRNSLKYAGAYIRSAWAQISQNVPAGFTDVTMRKCAIILGVSRAVMTQYYDIMAGDLIPGETADPIYEYIEVPNPAAASSTDGDGAAHPTTIPAIRLIHTAADARDLAAQAFVDLSEDERAIAAVIVNSTIGLPALQGYSLIMTQHHYLSDTKSQSRRAYDAVERQFWKSATIASWFSDSIDIVRDSCWHKSGHPLSISLKQTMARSHRVAAMITEAGAGSASARLPAVEAELRAANSYKTLLQTVRPLFDGYGGTVEFSVLLDAINISELYTTDGGPPAIPDGVSLPPGVNSRESAVAYLAKVLADNADSVAFCYGFYCALSDQNAMMGGTVQVDTLKASYSLSKLRGQSHAAYVSGVEAYGDYRAAKTAARAAGQYTPPKIVLV